MILDCYIMSGAGNIFTVVDNRHYNFSVEEGRRLAPLLCTNNGTEYTTEGLMLIAPSHAMGEHFRMEFFNPDGSHGAMCGNGGRCAVRFAAQQEIIPAGVDDITFSVLDAVYTAQLHGENVVLGFPVPKEVRFPHLLSIDGVTIGVGYVNVGSDHAVVQYDDIAVLTGADFDTFDIALWGARLRHHPDFMPRGVNANFYRLQPDGTVQLRTFERGVEAETGACGTGALATALVVAQRHGSPSPIRIIPTSDSMLLVDGLPKDGSSRTLTLEGTAVVLENIRLELPAGIYSRS